MFLFADALARLGARELPALPTEEYVCQATKEMLTRETMYVNFELWPVEDSLLIEIVSKG